jgi:hypothetical protein
MNVLSNNFSGAEIEQLLAGNFDNIDLSKLNDAELQALRE